jgi:hypothetical protein
MIAVLIDAKIRKLRKKMSIFWPRHGSAKFAAKI